MTDLWSGTYRESAVWGEMARALISSADLRPGMRVLDVGSAGGGTLFPALERVGSAGSVVGIDVDEEWVGWLQEDIAKRGIRNAENVWMNGEAMTFPGGAFDAVVMGMVGLDEDYDFETGQVLRGAPLMNEVSRVLKPGGSLSCSGWLWQDDSEWMRELVRRRLPDCTKHGYCPATAEGYVDLLEAVGFEDVRVTPHEGRYTFEDSAEWLACLSHVWEDELAQIRADSDALRAFEQDVADVLAGSLDEERKLAYTRSAVLVSARNPIGPRSSRSSARGTAVA